MFRWQTKNDTPLMQSAVAANLVTLERIYRAGVQRLLDRSALTLAASWTGMNVAWLLLDVDGLPDSGRNALHLAAANGHAGDVIAMLLLSDAGFAGAGQPAGGRRTRTALPCSWPRLVVRAATYLNMVETDAKIGYRGAGTCRLVPRSFTRLALLAAIDLIRLARILPDSEGGRRSCCRPGRSAGRGAAPAARRRLSG